MIFRTHINFAAGLALGASYVIGKTGIFASGDKATAVFFAEHGGYPVADALFLFIFVLIGAGFTDLDIKWYDKGHRVRSWAHKIESPLILMLAFGAAIPAAHMKSAASGDVSYAAFVSAAFCFCLGWFFHILGDFLQGGVGSYVARRKIGITSFRWDKYRTGLGSLFDLLFLVFAVGALVLFMNSPRADFNFGFFPALFNSGKHVFTVPASMGALLLPVVWLIVVAHGGYVSFVASCMTSVFLYLLWKTAMLFMFG